MFVQLLSPFIHRVVCFVVFEFLKLFVNPICRAVCKGFLPFCWLLLTLLNVSFAGDAAIADLIPCEPIYDKKIPNHFTLSCFAVQGKRMTDAGLLLKK